MAEKELAILLTARNQASGPIRKVTGDIGTLGKVSSRARAGVGALAKNVTLLGGAALVGLGAAVKAGLGSLAELENVTAQTNAVLRSTKGAANVTAASIRDLSNAIEDKTTIDDKQVQAAANLMLTFTNVRNEAGKGNDIFNQSISVLADMSTAMGTDMTSGAIQLGKALNDPVKGITALTRVGVTFDEKQQKQIKALVKAGKTAQAQKIILAELNKEFGGSGAAAANTYAGAMRRLDDAIEGAQVALAEGFLPVIKEASSWLRTKLADPRVIADIRELGRGLAGAFDKVLTTAETIPWGSIADAMRLAGQGAKAAYDLFTGLPPWLQTAVLTGWGLNKLTGGAVSGIVGELGKGLIKGVLGMNAGVVNINAGVVNGGGLPGGRGLPGPDVVGGKGPGLLGKLGLIGLGIGLAAAATEVSGVLDQSHQFGATNRFGGHTFRATRGETTAVPERQRTRPLEGSAGFNAKFMSPDVRAERAALERFTASTAPSMHSMEAHLARLREIQQRTPAEDRTNTNAIVSAIRGLQATIIANRPIVNVTARSVEKATVGWRRTASVSRVGID